MDEAQIPKDDVGQEIGPLDDQMQVVRLEQNDSMWAATTDEAVQDATVIIGSLPIHSVPVDVLFDSDSTHTFFS